MKILVTGANGLLGSKLVELLQKDQSLQCLFTGRRMESVDSGRHSFRKLDVTDKKAVLTMFGTFRPDVVIHTAAMTQVDDCEIKKEECWSANVTAVENIIEGCRENDAFLVHVSTDFIFDGSHGPLAEDGVPNPVNFYGKSKLAAENLIKASDIRWSILRTVLVYGVSKELSRTNIVLWVKNSLEQGKTIKVVNDQWRTPTIAEDLAMGCYLAAKQQIHGVFHISGAEMMTPYDIAIATADHFKLDKTLIIPSNSSEFKQVAARPLRTGFIIEKAKKTLGYQPHSFKEGLALVSRQLLELQPVA